MYSLRAVLELKFGRHRNRTLDEAQQVASIENKSNESRTSRHKRGRTCEHYESRLIPHPVREPLVRALEKTEKAVILELLHPAYAEMPRFRQEGTSWQPNKGPLSKAHTHPCTTPLPTPQR